MQDVQLAIINESMELLKNAPEVLQSNQIRSSKAIAVGNSILEQWQEAWNIKDEEQRISALATADERSNKYLANCSTALKEEKEARAAITQMMDEFKKLFTAAENEIDKSKPNTVPSKIQNNRDSYTKEVFRIQEERRKEAERIAAKAKEAVDIRANFETSLRAGFGEFLLKAKNWLTDKFNNLPLKDFADHAADIRMYKPVYKEEAFAALRGVTSKYFYHTDQELKAIHEEVKAPLYSVFSEMYASEMSDLQKELIDKIPSKQCELEEAWRLEQEAKEAAEKARIAEEARQAEIAKANAEEKKRLEEEAAKARAEEAKRQEELKAQQLAAEEARKKREAEEKAKLEAAAEEARKKAEQEIEIKKQGEQTLVMFEQEAAMVSVNQAPEARQGYEITVLHPVGYTQIFALWFENEGKNLPVDKIGNTKLDQMKSWAEKYAHKTDTKIESKFLKYENSYKAVTRKAK